VPDVRGDRTRTARDGLSTAAADLSGGLRARRRHL